MIEAEKFLGEYIKKASPFLESFLRDQKKRAGLVSPLATQMVGIYHDFIGGKRLRGALTFGSYQMFGGKAENDILKASAIVELIHAFGLMHDDIMDEDQLRRGKPTVHIRYRDLFKKKYPGNTRKNPEHFGISMALDVGDLGPFWANLILVGTKFPAVVKLRFLEILSETIITTIYGQGLDVHFESDPKPTLRKILQVHLFKTANYTITGPLRYGAVLAGASRKTNRYQALSLYGTPVGIAFQLRDDELGLFSTPEKLGKASDSDLKEGKNTLLFLKALENGRPEQKAFIKYAHGNRGITPVEVAAVRKIVTETGALEYSQRESRRLVEKGKRFIPQITANRRFQELLEVLADYVIERES